jgi:hypothetical protein
LVGSAGGAGFGVGRQVAGTVDYLATLSVGGTDGAGFGVRTQDGASDSADVSGSGGDVDLAPSDNSEHLLVSSAGGASRQVGVDEGEFEVGFEQFGVGGASGAAGKVLLDGDVLVESFEKFGYEARAGEIRTS